MAKKASEPTREYPFPSSEEAEAGVVASILLEPGWLDELDLDPADFFLDESKHLFQAELALRDRGEHIDQMSLAREVRGKVPAWVIPKIIAQLPTSLDCAYYAEIVKDMSRRRALLEIGESLRKDAYNTEMSSGEVLDKARATLEAITFPSKMSRAVIFSNPRIVTSEPPTYLIKVASANEKRAVDIRFTSPELDNSTAFKRKIREKLQINPVLPKSFDSLIHSLVKQAKTQFAPKDASADENICFWIREWLKTAIEAEHSEDLTQGYLEREGAYWFQSTRMLKYLNEKAKVKLTPSSFWPIIQGRGGRRSKVFRLGESTVRLWGLDKKFFEAEAEEKAEEEQLPLVEEKPKEIPKGEAEDLSWLEQE